MDKPNIMDLYGVKSFYKRLHLGFDELKRLLSRKAFKAYAETYEHVYVTFTQTGSYFVIMDFDDNALAICVTLPELEEYYGKKSEVEKDGNEAD